MSTTRRAVTLHGHRMAYLEACPEASTEDPEVLVLLHGVAGSSSTWQPVLDRLEAEGCRHLVIVPDLLGQGSPRARAATSRWAPTRTGCATCSRRSGTGA